MLKKQKGEGGMTGFINYQVKVFIEGNPAYTANFSGRISEEGLPGHVRERMGEGEKIAVVKYYETGKLNGECFREKKKGSRGYRNRADRSNSAQWWDGGRKK